MIHSIIESTAEDFASRLSTLEHLLIVGSRDFPEDQAEYLNKRLTDDMLPLGTQVAFTCNQPRNFALWIKGRAASDLDPQVHSLAHAVQIVRETQSLVRTIVADDGALPPTKHLDLGGSLHADLTGHQYIKDFLVPNFYFHFVTAYSILRMAGVQVGKHDYMMHLLPHVKEHTA